MQKLVKCALHYRLEVLRRDADCVMQPCKLDKSELETTVPRLMLDFFATPAEGQAAAAAAAAATTKEERKKADGVPLKELVSGVEAFDMTDHEDSIILRYKACGSAQQQFEESSDMAVKKLGEVAISIELDTSKLDEACNARSNAIKCTVALLNALEEYEVRMKAYNFCVPDLWWQKDFVESLAQEVKRRKKLYEKVACALRKANEVMDTARAEDEQKRREFCERNEKLLDKLDERLRKLLAVAPEPRTELLPTVYDRTFVEGALPVEEMREKEKQQKAQQQAMRREQIQKLVKESSESSRRFRQIAAKCDRALGVVSGPEDMKLTAEERASNAVERLVANVPTVGDTVLFVRDLVWESTAFVAANIKNPRLVVRSRQVPGPLAQKGAFYVRIQSMEQERRGGQVVYVVSGDFMSLEQKTGARLWDTRCL